MNNIPTTELKLLKKLNNPVKIQDFLDQMPINFEPDGDGCLSPMSVLEQRTCHCIEGAVLAALALYLTHQPPLILDLMANKNDYDHVVAVFKKDGKWGAISKTNHVALRYREPIYKSIRELVMSYFHEYTDDLGRKNLRSYTRPVNLTRFNGQNWMTTKDNIFFIPEYLVEIKHYPILDKNQIRGLRKADAFETRIGQLTEWPK